MNEYTFYNPETVRYWGEHKRKAKDIDHLRKNMIYLHTKGRDHSWVVWMGRKPLGTLKFVNDTPVWIPQSNYKPDGEPRLVDPKTGKLMGRY